MTAVATQSSEACRGRLDASIASPGVAEQVPCRKWSRSGSLTVESTQTGVRSRRTSSRCDHRFPGVQATRVQAVHVPALQTWSVPQAVPSVTFAVSTQTDVPVEQDVVPV